MAMRMRRCAVCGKLHVNSDAFAEACMECLVWSLEAMTGALRTLNHSGKLAPGEPDPRD